MTRKLCQGAPTIPHATKHPTLTTAAVLLGKQVIGKRWGVRQTLQGGVEEAGVAQVVETGSDTVHPLPFQREALHREEDLLWGWNSISSQGVLTACQRGRRTGEVSEAGYTCTPVPTEPFPPEYGHTLLPDGSLFRAPVSAGVFCLGVQ